MYVFLLFLAIFFLDQGTKWYVQATIPYGTSIPVWGDILQWTYILNRGAAFGTFTGMRYLLLGVALLCVLALVYYRATIRKGGRLAVLAATLFAGGLAGNTFDRLTRPGVVDFIHIGWWPIFNIADIALTLGVVCATIALWSYSKGAS